MKTNEPISMQTGRCGPWGKGMKRSTLGVTVKVWYSRV